MAKKNAINNETQELTIDPGASGDSFIQLDINATGEFRIGVDDTDDSFRISQGSALGTNDTFIMTAAGERTMPLQPAFLATLTSDDTNQTGDGTGYTVVWDAEVFDQGGDFDGTSTFTAPVTALYRFESSILLGDLAAANNNGSLTIVTSNRSYGTQHNPGASRDTNDEFSVFSTVLADMDAADTATITIRVVGGTKIVDLMSNGATDPQTWFSGNLEV